MTETKKCYDPILAATARIKNYAEAISDAHSFGYGPGPVHDPWTRDFSEKAVLIYALTLPWPYLTGLAHQYATTARLMTINGSPPGIHTAWVTTADYLRNTSDTILAYSPRSGPSAQPRPLSTRSPSVKRFDLVAEIASQQGVDHLHAAAATVHQALTSTGTEHSPNPLTASQGDLLRRLAEGERLIDLANSLGFSERTLHRRLNTIWTRLGVHNRTEGIAIAASNGWIDLRDDRYEVASRQGFRSKDGQVEPQ